jgi:cytochrome P450 family 103
VNTSDSKRSRRSEPPTVPTAQLDHDPHGTFRRYRLVTPFLRREDDSYIAIRHGDVERLATDTRTRQMETERLQARGINSGALFELFENTMLYSNGPAHRRRRAPMSSAFAFRLIDELRLKIRAVAHQLLDRVERRGEMNLLDDFAALIPAHITSEILGLPEHDIPDFTRWVYSIARAVSFTFTPAEWVEMEAAARDLSAYVLKLLAQRRARPRDDFLSSYAISVEAEGNLSRIEMLTQIVTVILAGSETTRAALALQVALLLQHQEQWEAVRRDPTLIPGAVSESLRYEPSVASTPRFTLGDIEIAGFVVPAGRMLSLSTLSAMRDPALYTEPDSFNIRRTDHPRRHLAFGSGPHRCLGEVLARAELEEGLAALVERFPELRLVGEAPKALGHVGIRRVSPMRVAWSN